MMHVQKNIKKIAFVKIFSKSIKKTGIYNKTFLKFNGITSTATATNLIC